MENEFVTYEQAVALNELGCYGPLRFYSAYLNLREREIFVKMSDHGRGYLSVPTKSKVFRWFREKYDIQGYIYSSTVRGNKEGTKQFTGYVWNINGIDMPFISTDARYELHDTYEEAENACIDKLISICKQQDK